jgi:hypothetical protein
LQHCALYELWQPADGYSTLSWLNEARTLQLISSGTKEKSITET